MTHKYNLIHLNGKMYAVDKEAEIYINDIAIHRNDGYRNRHPNGDDIITKATKGNCSSIQEHWVRIVASSDPSLNLPLLPPIEEDVHEIARNAVFGANHLDTAVHYYVKGYKAAKAKRWTDEEVVRLIELFCEYENVYELADEKLLAKAVESYRTIYFNPLPIAVEVEMEEKIELLSIGSVTGAPPRTEKVLVPKVDANNFIIVKRRIWKENQ